ncbi:MAG: hypothetical protein AAFY15_08650, partial [Cyanobacteria bacterium J06648_11]
MATWRAVVTAIAALACGLSVWACTPRIDGGTNAGHPTLAFEGNPPEWADSGASVMAELERWRGLEFQTDVRVSFLSQSEPGLNGWYNSQTKQLVVATTESAQLGRSVLLHELFHALQDQSFNLYALRQQSVETPDANQTLSAIIEGEAMLAVSELLNYDFLAHAQLPKTDSLRDERFNNIFLYGDGMKFVMAVRDAGGWDAVDRLFQDPPRSTALIFNPERYLAGEREIEGVDVPLAPGDRLQSQSVRGEYQVRLLLARQPDTRSLLDAMDGAYVSDTFGTIEAADGTTLHRWVIAFSSADIAQTIEPGITTAIV